MLSLEQARAILLDGVGPIATEKAAIADCAGRIAATDVYAQRDQPPAAVSAMDGYALRLVDAAPGAELTVIGESPAGAPFSGRVQAGQAVRIATGGVVPDGADQIIIQECVERIGDRIRIADRKPGEPNWIRPAGSDFARGSLVARTGDRITPGRHALLAAANVGSVELFARPSVAILPSGDELREPGEELGPGQVVNSATYALIDLVEAWGGRAERMPILPDDRTDCRSMLGSLDRGFDVLVTIGGASVGDRDLLRPLLIELGAEMMFDRIAVQPGKPSWHARFPDGRLVLGLPGNPASAFVCAHLLLKPLLYRLTGRSADEATAMIRARLAEPLGANGARETFLRGRCRIGEDGVLRTAALPAQDSSLVSTLALADCLIRRARHAVPAPADETVELLPTLTKYLRSGGPR